MGRKGLKGPHLKAIQQSAKLIRKRLLYYKFYLNHTFLSFCTSHALFPLCSTTSNVAIDSQTMHLRKSNTEMVVWTFWPTGDGQKIKFALWRLAEHTHTRMETTHVNIWTEANENMKYITNWHAFSALQKSEGRTPFSNAKYARGVYAKLRWILNFGSDLYVLIWKMLWFVVSVFLIDIDVDVWEKLLCRVCIWWFGWGRSVVCLWRYGFVFE